MSNAHKTPSGQLKACFRCHAITSDISLETLYEGPEGEAIRIDCKRCHGVTLRSYDERTGQYEVVFSKDGKFNERPLRKYRHRGAMK